MRRNVYDAKALLDSVKGKLGLANAEEAVARGWTAAMRMSRVLAALAVASVALVSGAEGQTMSAKPKPPLPGLQVGPAPWTSQVGTLSERLDLIGLPAMPSEAFVQHIHQRLTITINGAPTTIPAQIGISRFPQFISPIHTHDTTGTIHIEAATKETFTLGQFFDVWGVRLTTQCVGGYCSQGGNSLKIMSNGAPVKDPRSLPLQDHQVIEISFGPKRPPG